MKAVTNNSRRKFIGTLALGAGAELTAMVENFKFNSQPNLVLGDADSWFKKIKGSHRVVFDAAEPNNAMGIIWTNF